MIDKSRIFDMTPLFILMGCVVLAKQFPAYEELILGGGWGGMIVFMFAFDLILLKITGGCKFIDAFCDSFPQHRLQFYSSDIDFDIPTPKEDGWYTSVFKPKWEVKHPSKGKIEVEIPIHHRGLFADRVEFRPGRAEVWDEEFDHPSVGEMVLKELDMEGTDIERTSPIPIFMMLWGNKDEAGDTGLVEYYNKSHNPSLSLKGLKEINKELLQENRRVKRANLELKRRSMKDHRERLATQESSDSVVNELAALQDTPTKTSVAVTRTFLALHKAAGTIDNMRDYFPQRRFSSLTKTAAAVIMFLATLAYVAYYPETIDKIISYSSQYWYVVLIAVAVVGYIVYTKRRK